MAGAEDRREIRDVRVLAALAHPVRTALLSHLMAVGPRTASECARAVDASPSNCSWHLRHLARFGLVERAVAGADGRERPWRATATGFSFAPPAGPAARAAGQALASVRLDESTRLARRYLRGEDDLPDEWRAAAALSTYGLVMEAAELTELIDRLDALIRPYIGMTRANAPEGARPVHLSLTAFLRPEEA
jgi:DNA-binding transcriptional ArsR family regulator